MKKLILLFVVIVSCEWHITIDMLIVNNSEKMARVELYTKTYHVYDFNSENERVIEVDTVIIRAIAPKDSAVVHVLDGGVTGYKGKPQDAPYFYRLEHIYVYLNDTIRLNTDFVERRFWAFSKPREHKGQYTLVIK